MNLYHLIIHLFHCNTIGKSELALESFTTTDVDSGSANSKAFPDTFTFSICPDEPNEEGAYLINLLLVYLYFQYH